MVTVKAQSLTTWEWFKFYYYGWKICSKKVIELNLFVFGKWIPKFWENYYEDCQVKKYLAKFPHELPSERVADKK